MDKIFSLNVDDSFEYNLKESDLNNLDLIKINHSKFHLINHSKTFEIEVEKADFNSKNYTLKVNSNTYKVNIKNQLDLLIKEMGFSVGSSKKANDIKAPMPGLILGLQVDEGQEVLEGDTLLILEAMKMENAICAPKDGIVKTISVKTGDTVEKNELLIEMS